MPSLALRSFLLALPLALARPVEFSSLAANASVAEEKRGLAWSSGDYVSMDVFGGGNVSWYYTWSPTSVAQAQTFNMCFVPMLWGEDQTSLFKALADKDFEGSVLTERKDVLAFNEPNLEEQSNLSPQEAADLWNEYLQPLKARGYRLGAPVTTSAPEGLVWMQNFTLACNCTPDFFPLHYYDRTFEGFRTYVENWRSAFNSTIWVTEWACQDFNGDDQCTAEEISTFFDKATNFMDSVDYVERFAPFGAFFDMTNVNPLNGLLSNDSAGNISLSALGRQYVTGVPAGNFDAPEGVKSTSSSGSSGDGDSTSSAKPRWHLRSTSFLLVVGALASIADLV